MAASLSQLLRKKPFPSCSDDEAYKEDLKRLQLEMLRIQQGVWHSKGRAVLVFEGFDAAGKGGAIRRITEQLDPRGVAVHPIGPPTADEQGRHWLYRFWTKLPAPGTIAIFDRSWYGRVLVERVEKLADEQAIARAYREINEFEAALVNDGIAVVKFFLGISKDEQLKRFEQRLNDPYKFWKFTEDDVRARRHWTKYVQAVDIMLAKTSSRKAPWHLVPADFKRYTRKRVLEVVADELRSYASWLQRKAAKRSKMNLKKELRSLR